MKKTKKKRIVALLMAVLFSLSIGNSYVPSFAEDKDAIEDSASGDEEKVENPSYVITDEDGNIVYDSESETEALKEEKTDDEALTEVETTAEVTAAMENVEEISSEGSSAEEVTEEDTSVDVVTEDTQEVPLAEITEERASEEVITEAEPTEEVTTEATTASDVTIEVTSENIEKQPTFTTLIEGVDVSGIDFSSKELLIGTEDPAIFTWDTEVVSEYNGIYLTRYQSEEETRNAYTYYYGKADFVDANVVFTVQDNEESADLSQLNEGDDAISNLNDMDAETVPSKTIAVIDTGINASDLVGSVSVLGGSSADDNGHGTRMYEYIKDEYPNAKILSIKAMGSDGKGQISDVYAAIQYAIESKVDIINLSISAYSVAGSDVIENVINDAVSQGIIVVGAAGNNGKNAKYFIPGGIDSAIIVGSCDENGTKLSDSNYGATVDYNVSSDSTSEAAARMSGIIASDDDKSKATVFTPNYSAEDMTGGIVTFSDGSFHVAWEYGDPDTEEGRAKRSHQTDTYVTASGVYDASINAVSYEYYLNGTRYNTGMDKDGLNAICIEHGVVGGLVGDGFDIDTSKCENWSNNAELCRLLYNLLADNSVTWHQMHLTICYYLNQTGTHTYGNTEVTLPISADKYNSYRTTAIPENKKITVTFLYNANHDARLEAPLYDTRTFQHYLTWKVETLNEYFVAVKKEDNAGNAMNGVTFDITVNGTTKTKALTSGKYVNGSTTADTTRGVASYRLGYFETVPTVSVKENWSNNGYVANTTSKNVTVYTTKATAESNAASFTYTNTIKAFVGIYKKDEKGNNVAASFDIYGTNTSGATSGGTKIGSISTTASNGKVSLEVTNYYNPKSENISGKYRYFYASEVGTPTGKVVTVRSRALTVKTGALANADYLSWVNPDQVYVRLTKSSSNTQCTNGNPNYSLVGTTYQMFGSASDASNAALTGNYSAALTSFTVTAASINASGSGVITKDVSQWMTGHNADGSLQSKTFYFVESAAGKNYKRATGIKSVTVTASNTSSNPAQLNVTDEPVNDPFDIELIKTDIITGSHQLPKGKTLAGAQFRVNFYAADIETVLANANGNVASYLTSHYSPVADYSSTVTVTKRTDGTFKASINNNGDPFPIGFIVITEIQSPPSYSLTDAAQYIVDSVNNTETNVTGNLAFVTYGTFSNNQSSWAAQTIYPNNATTIAELTSSTGNRHGISVDAAGYEIKVENQPIRGNIRLQKVAYSDGKPLKGVEFVIKNTETGETHSLFTDANGNATTVGNADTWFSKSTDADEDYPYTAGYGSLPTGTYTLTEKRSDANEGYQLLAPIEFTVTTSSTQVISASENKLYNIEMPYITTTAMDEATMSKSLAQGETGTIVDTIKYYHLRANSKFYLVGTLMVRYPDGTYEAYQKDGEPYTVTSSAINTPAAWTKSEFEIDGEYVMEFPDVDPAGYEGCSFVVFQKLYYNAVPTDDANAAQYKEYDGTDEKIFPVLHEDIESEGQTVRPVDIHTNAWDGITKDNISKPEGTVTIVDRVSYTGLTIDEEYTITGTLHVTGYTWKDAEGNEIKTVDADDTLLNEDGTPVTASQTFTAESTDGYIDLEFTCDASLLAGESVVAFEELIYKDKVLALHADLKDENETIHFGNIHTTLYRGGTEEWAEDFDEEDITKVTTVDESSKEVMAAEDAVVVDRIKYHNLLANRHYIIKGVLMDKETKEPFVDADGNTVEVTYEFDTPTVEAVEDTNTPNSVKYICADGTELDMSADYADYLVDGYAEVEFPKFNGTGMDGKTLVAYEEIYIVHTDETTGEEVESLVSEHKDIDDNDQTVRFPEIHTNADVEETNTKMVPIDGPVTINDTVTFTNLIIGKEYKLTAELVVKNDETGTYEDGDALLDKNGKPITAEITFVPEDTDGEVVVHITFDGYLMPEVEIVCFETLSNDKGLDIAVHSDIEDEDQTTGLVKVRTTAKTEGTDGQDTLATEETVIIDTVAFERLEPDLTYKVCGTLMQVSTGKELLDKDGNPITAETTFVPENSEGTVDVVFPAFDATELALEGDSIVVFERIYLIKTTEGTGEETEEGKDTEEEEILIGHHEDIDDEGQTIYVPEIHTTAMDSETEDHVGKVSEEVTIIDKVDYKNLIVGKEYTVKGVLMVKETEKPLMVDGKEVAAEKTFKADKADGFVELEFTFDSSALEGITVVVFEDIYRDKYHVAVHNDIDDEDQTIDFPKVKTKAEDAVTKENIGKAEQTTTIIDTVSYKNLIVGKEYTIKGVLMNKDTGLAFLADGKLVTAEKTFKAETKDGTVELQFTFDGSTLAGTKIVVFEDIYYKGVRVDTHSDLEDKEQTVNYPSVRTHVEDTAKHVQSVENITVNDDVMYTKLLSGKKYKVVGKLMSKSTGKEVMVDGKPVEVTKEFTAEAEDGMITMSFNFDATGLEGDVTVFEYLYLIDGKDEILVAEHTDLEDEDQTFIISPIPDTGDHTPVGMMFGILLLSAMGITFIIWKKKKLNND